MYRPVEAFIYLNLDDRPDRNEFITRELEGMGVPVHRVSGVRLNDAESACSMGHCAMVRFAKDAGYCRVGMFEDDFMWKNKGEALFQIRKLSQFQFDGVTMEYGGMRLSLPGKSLDSNIRKVKRFSRRAAVIVDCSCFDFLIDVFSEAARQRKPPDTAMQRRTQQLDWYAFCPPLGKQECAFGSDLESTRQRKNRR